MSAKDIASLGKLLAQFLALFAGCFTRPAGRRLLRVYVQGLLGDVQRKNVEAMALDQDVAPRTLQRFLESIRWDHDALRDQCQRIIASEHSDADAIGCIDETGTAKSGSHTAGVKRQYNGNRGKIENCVNVVATSYTAKDFHCLLDARLHLPKEWAGDAARRKKIMFPITSGFRRSLRSRWIRSTTRKPMALPSRLGRSMKTTVEMVTFSTVLMHGVRHSLAKCRRNFMLGLASPRFSEARQNAANEDDNIGIHDWHVATPSPARSATWPCTRRASPNNEHSDTVSKTITRGQKSGKSAGTPVGERHIIAD